MPGTTKGIYIKSNPTCAPGKTVQIYYAFEVNWGASV